MQQNSVVSQGTPVYEMQDFSVVLSSLKLPKNKKCAKKKIMTEKLENKEKMNFIFFELKINCNKNKIT